jgi:GNAT superfamily N-acetyltransferase
MCAEKEPLDCHRTILVCRHLRNRGIAIRHILADGQAEDHAAAERRLLRLTKEERTLFEPDVSEEELLRRAYEKRGRQIAYRMCAEGDSP